MHFLGIENLRIIFSRWIGNWKIFGKLRGCNLDGLEIGKFSENSADVILMDWKLEIFRKTRMGKSKSKKSEISKSPNPKNEEISKSPNQRNEEISKTQKSKIEEISKIKNYIFFLKTISKSDRNIVHFTLTYFTFAPLYVF